MKLQVFGLGAWLLLSAACGGKPVAQGPTTNERRPSNPQAVAKLAQGAAAAKEPSVLARAAELFREALSIDPGLWEARYNLGIVLTAQGELDKAQVELSRASKDAPNEESIVVALAEVERRRNHAKSAVEALETFLKAHPKAKAARTAYVSALRDAKQPDKALEQARELLLLAPGDPGALAELALCYLAKGDAETASLVAKQAVDGASAAGTSQKNDGASAAGTSQKNDGASAAGTSQKNDGASAAGRPDGASAAGKGEGTSAAGKADEKSLKLERSKSAAKAYVASAFVAFARGNDAEAFAAFQKAAELDPSDPTPKMNMGTIFLRAGQFAKAEEQFRGVLAGARDDTEALVGLAVAQRGQGSQETPGKWNDARITLERVLSLDKNNADALYNLGVLYMDFLKKPGDARSSFERFNKAAPSSHPKVADAKRALAELQASKGTGP